MPIFLIITLKLNLALWIYRFWFGKRWAVSTDYNIPSVPSVKLPETGYKYNIPSVKLPETGYKYNSPRNNSEMIKIK